jgi:DNA end-binding protein Ku
LTFLTLSGLFLFYVIKSAMRAIWTGTLTFGLISIPVKLYAAAEEPVLDLDFLHAKDLKPIRYARVCTKEEREVPYEEIVRGYEYKEGEYVVVTEEDFARADLGKGKSIDLHEFTEEASIDPLLYKRPYFLEPDQHSDKAYALLAQALHTTGKVGIATMVMRGREMLCMLRSDKKHLYLIQLRFANELRSPKDLNVPDVDVSIEEARMAVDLIEHLSQPFQPEDYHDTYHDAVMKVIKEKIAGKEPKKTPMAPEKRSATVGDLMPLLRASLEKRPRKRRKEEVRVTETQEETADVRH